MSLYTKKGKAAFISLSVILLLVGVPTAIVFKYLDAAFFLMLTGFAVMFFFFLELEIDRVTKGLILIFSGILFGIYYPDFVFSSVQLNENMKDKIDIFKQFCIFASAGAGGSIIAAHADKYSTDNEHKTIQKTVIDRTEEIKALQNSITNLSSNVKSLQYGGFIILVLLFISVAI